MLRLPQKPAIATLGTLETWPLDAINKMLIFCHDLWFRKPGSSPFDTKRFHGRQTDILKAKVSAPVSYLGGWKKYLESKQCWLVSSTVEEMELNL
jgi:hypothetical protein